MPTAKCQSCHKTINFDPKHLGRKCKCPGCGTTVLLTNDFEFDFRASEERPAAAPDPGWFYRHEGALAIVDVGPLKKSEVMRDVNHGKINHKTAVWHQIETGGQPVFAESIDWIRDAVSSRNRIELEAKSEAKQARQRANAKIVADAKNAAEQASRKATNYLISGGIAVRQLLANPLFWGIALLPFSIFNLLFAYISLPILIYKLGTKWFESRSYTRPIFATLAISSTIVLAQFDYSILTWSKDSPTAEALYHDYFYRWTGSHFRDIYIKDSFRSLHMSGWMSKSGKPHGKWTSIVFMDDPPDYRVSTIWFWYGEEVTEGQFVLMSKK